MKKRKLIVDLSSSGGRWSSQRLVWQYNDVATPKFLDNEDVESKMMMITLTQELMMTLRMIMMKKRRRQ